MKLTKQQAIAEHRKMWNWIADEIESKRKYKHVYATVLKAEYLLRHNYGPIRNNCFCCEFSDNEDIRNRGDICEYCPIDWGAVGCWVESSPYASLCSLAASECKDRDYKKEIVELCRQIANLPERK